MLNPTCERYAEIKAFQYMLNKFLRAQNTNSISNTSILSIMYLLQNTGESLQAIQVSRLSMHVLGYNYFYYHLFTVR